ncbi:MAG: ATP-grasp domain-containing protein [Gammaproteobacteria bacterium]|nr:ATP-grasp domain-containing protein [Gammaproteobacteria bacterium]
MTAVLVTGARAPSALEIIRGLASGGYKVHAADCQDIVISKFSKAVIQYHFLASPRHEFEKFRSQILSIVKKYDIKYIIPTCEEVFYLAFIHERCPDEFPEDLNFIVGSYKDISVLHHKVNYKNILNTYNIRTPRTFLFESLEQLENYKNLKLIFKPVYSRYANKIIISAEKFTKYYKNNLNIKNTQWAVQEFIDGKEICCYGIAVNGRLTAFSCYEPVYRAGVGAGIYFKAIYHQEIKNLIQNLVAGLNYSGQIAFDIILKDGIPYFIECNPRATSGVHLFKNKKLASALMGTAADCLEVTDSTPKMLLAAMLIYGPKNFIKYNFRPLIRDFRMAKDVVYDTHDSGPFFAQFKIMRSLIAKSLFNKSELLDLTVNDIVYEGEIN